MAASTQKFTSESTRKIVREAQSFFLAEGAAPPDAEETLADLASRFDELRDDERERIEELVRLSKLSDAAGGSSIMEGMSRNGSFETSLSDDKMLLTVRMQPPLAGGEPVAAETILAWLRKQNLAQGVEMAAIRSAVARAASGEVVEDVVVVRGRDPQPGEPERFEVFGRRSPEGELCILRECGLGRNRRELITCHAGDRILRRVPPTPGRSGYDAAGEVLEPSSPPDHPLEIGENVRAAGDDYFAEVSGLVMYDGRRIAVRKVLVLSQDLTKADGPIVFDGDVHARGAVRDGAAIRATGSIQVDGPVEAATIESTGSDVVLSHGVAGRNRGIIRAGGDVSTRFAENVTISARGSIIVEMGSLHSHLTAGEAIRLPRGRGQLLGGVAMAGQVVEAKQFGADSGVVTDVSVGLSLAVMDAVGEVDAVIREMRQRHDAAAELAERMKRTVGDPAKLSRDELATYTRLRQAELTCDLKLRQLDRQRQEILDEAAEEHGGSVDVLGQMFPRVIVRIGSATLDNRELRRSCRFQYDEEDHRVEAVPLR